MLMYETDAEGVLLSRLLRLSSALSTLIVKESEDAPEPIRVHAEALYEALVALAEATKRADLDRILKDMKPEGLA